jgi:FkbM family methyltransferase
MRLRSLIGKPVRWLLAEAGYDLVNLNAFHDMRARIAELEDKLTDMRSQRDHWQAIAGGTIPAGYDLVNLNAFGHDPFRDIRLLNEKWNSSVRTFFDVGANDGDTSLKALKQFPQAQIFAFEPHPDTFLGLKYATKDHSAIDPVQTALGAEAGDQVMYVYDVSLINSLVPNAPYSVRFGGKHSSSISVKCTTVDLFCAERNIKKIDVLKIDTEGFDLEVLKGAAAMLKRGAISFVYFEFNDIQPDKNSAGGALAPIDEFLRRYQYRFIASYNDYVVTDGDLFAVSNALYALPKKSRVPEVR